MKTEQKKLIQSTLIQRLRSPELPSWFGASGAEGYFNETAWNLISPIFSFDYMGSAEFEDTTTPEVFMELGERYVEDKIVTGKIDLGSSVNYICKNEHEEEVVRRITLLGNFGDYHEKVWGLKEATHFKRALDCEEGFEKYRGWLEINNGYMFFLDKEMFEKTDAMFRSFKE